MWSLTHWVHRKLQKSHLYFLDVPGTAHHLHAVPDQLLRYDRPDPDRGPGHQSHSAPPAVHHNPANLLQVRDPHSAEERNNGTGCRADKQFQLSTKLERSMADVIQFRLRQLRHFGAFTVVCISPFHSTTYKAKRANFAEMVSKKCDRMLPFIMMFQKTTWGRNSRLESDKQLFVKCIVFITTYLDYVVCLDGWQIKGKRNKAE